MFTTQGEKDDTPFCIVNGGKSNGEIVFIKKKDKKESVVKYKPVMDVDLRNGEFELLPNDDQRVIFIFGSAGSGKTYFAAKYIKKYLKIHPKAEFYVFSQVQQDEPIDKLRPHRIMIDESLIANPINLDEIEPGSMILFDDIDSLPDKELQKSVNTLKKQILEHGRHSNLNIINISHLANGNDRNTSRVILLEAKNIVFFPKSGSAYNAKYILKTQLGLSPKQITSIMNIDSRWISIRTTYPQALLAEGKAIILSSL